jgi:hypothetical protein
MRASSVYRRGSVFRSRGCCWRLLLSLEHFVRIRGLRRRLVTDAKDTDLSHAEAGGKLWGTSVPAPKKSYGHATWGTSGSQADTRRCQANASFGQRSGGREFLFVRSFLFPKFWAVRAKLSFLGLLRNRGMRLPKTKDLAFASSKILCFNIGSESRGIARSVDGMVLKYLLSRGRYRCI